MSSKPPRIGVISLGCSKNLVDTEVMLGHLDRAGCAFVTDPARADVLVVNTCSFIDAAREESVQAILDAAAHKKSGKVKRLVVAGCLVQRYRADLERDLPEVDAFVGLDEIESIAAAAGIAAPAPPSDLPIFRPAPASTYLYGASTPRRRATPRWTAYVKIAEGCDHTCAFCAIPSFRGAFRSRPIDDVEAEVRSLAAAGVREVNLIAQDSSHYGRDRGERGGLGALLERLDAIEALRWIRAHYLYPNTVDARLIETMARLPKVVRYVDMPLQHAHPETLKRMRRGGSGDGHLELLGRFRTAMPDATLRSTFIVGFPGESDAEFETLLEFVRHARLDHLGVFTYSHEESTAAFGLVDDVPADVKRTRRAALMEAQQSIVFERHAARIGEECEVLVEGPHPETAHLLVGRTRGQAPDVDGQILIHDGIAAPGAFVRVRITEAAGYDLVGAIVGAA